MLSISSFVCPLYPLVCSFCLFSACVCEVRVPHASCFTPSRALLCSRCVRIRARSRRPCSPTANRQLPTERTPNTSIQSILAGLTPVLGAFPALRTLDLSPTAVDGVGRGNALEEAALCTTWARACPALRCVVFPSGAVWRRRGGGEDGQGHGGEVWVPEAAAGVVWTRY